MPGGLGYPSRRARHRRKDGVVKRGHAAIRTPIRLHIGLDNSGDIESSRSVDDLMADGHILNALHRANEGMTWEYQGRNAIQADWHMETDRHRQVDLQAAL